jgi:hypothetical protein
MEKLVANGAYAQLRLKVAGSMRAIAMVSNVNFDESYQIQPLNVIGHLGPISYDSQGYSCSVSIGTFIPEKNLTVYADGGEITIRDILPTRSEVQINGKGAEFELLDIVNKATGQIIAAFSTVILDSNGGQVNPNAYMSSNLRFLAVEKLRT